MIDKKLQMIYEGMYDPILFKAIFVVGGPGSGKTYVTKKLGLQAMGFVSIDSDYPLEKYMTKQNLSLKMPEHEKEERDIVRQRAKDVTKSKQDSILEQGLGLIIGGTGANINDIEKMASTLRSIGYTTSAIFVNADLKTAKHRNQKRSRSVPEHILFEKWKAAQKNIGYFQQKFDPFFIIDNSEGSNTDDQISSVFKKIYEWGRKEPKNRHFSQKMQSWKTDKGIQ